MDQARLEAEGVGYRCRSCGISVLGEPNTTRTCTGCTPQPPQHDTSDPVRVALENAISIMRLNANAPRGTRRNRTNREHDIEVLQSILDQRGCEHFDAAVKDGRLTTLIGVIING